MHTRGKGCSHAMMDGSQWSMVYHAPGRWEKHCGRAASKKWRASISVKCDALPACRDHGEWIKISSIEADPEGEA